MDHARKGTRTFLRRRLKKYPMLNFLVSDNIKAPVIMMNTGTAQRLRVLNVVAVSQAPLEMLFICSRYGPKT